MIYKSDATTAAMQLFPNHPQVDLQSISGQSCEHWFHLNERAHLQIKT